MVDSIAKNKNASSISGTDDKGMIYPVRGTMYPFGALCPFGHYSFTPFGNLRVAGVGIDTPSGNLPTTSGLRGKILSSCHLPGRALQTLSPATHLPWRAVAGQVSIDLRCSGPLISGTLRLYKRMILFV